jgi:hypothetical protein
MFGSPKPTDYPEFLRPIGPDMSAFDRPLIGMSGRLRAVPCLVASRGLGDNQPEEVVAVGLIEAS